jgi:CO dehydrogenase maturation factor
MKISISGKGGSGKSTVTTLLALDFQEKGYRPIVVDSDESNSVLFRLLGMPKPPQPLITLAGGRQMVRELLPPGYKPGAPGVSTNVLTQAKITLADLPLANVAKQDNLNLIIVGKINEPLEGCACPMGVLGREFLGKLSLAKNEIVIADMEAGLEHFGRGVESSLDTVLAVVEPSFESVNLAERIQHLAGGIGIQRFWVILNKVSSKKLQARLETELTSRGIPIIGAIPYDDEVFTACLEGRAISKNSRKISRALNQITNSLLAPLK